MVKHSHRISFTHFSYVLKMWSVLYEIWTEFLGLQKETQRSWFRKEHTSTLLPPLSGLNMLYNRRTPAQEKMQGKFCLPMVYKWGINCQAVSLRTSLPLLMLQSNCIPWSSLRSKAEHHSEDAWLGCRMLGWRVLSLKEDFQLLSLLMTAELH